MSCDQRAPALPNRREDVPNIEARLLTLRRVLVLQESLAVIVGNRGLRLVEVSLPAGIRSSSLIKEQIVLIDLLLRRAQPTLSPGLPEVDQEKEAVSISRLLELSLAAASYAARKVIFAMKRRSVLSAVLRSLIRPVLTARKVLTWLSIAQER